MSNQAIKLPSGPIALESPCQAYVNNKWSPAVLIGYSVGRDGARKCHVHLVLTNEEHTVNPNYLSHYPQGTIDDWRDLLKNDTIPAHLVEDLDGLKLHVPLSLHPYRRAANKQDRLMLLGEWISTAKERKILSNEEGQRILNWVQQEIR